jgi:hypothetical protein
MTAFLSVPRSNNRQVGARKRPVAALSPHPLRSSVICRNLSRNSLGAAAGTASHPALKTSPILRRSTHSRTPAGALELLRLARAGGTPVRTVVAIR